MPNVITMRDVATAAGVSSATVSRVLSGAGGFSPGVEKVVLETCRKLGYRPNHVARSLRQRSTQTVAMVVPDIVNPFFPAVVQAVEQALHDSRMSLFLCDSQGSPEVEADRVRALLDRRVDGLIISPVHRTRSMNTVADAAAQVPTIQVDRHVSVATDYVGVNQPAGIRAVIRHLSGQGRSRFAFVASSEGISTSADRVSAYRREIAERQLAGADRILTGSFSIQWGHEATQKILQSGEVPDAIICGNDLIALGLLAALRREGIAVPDQIAVSGFDNNPLCELVDPALTSVNQPLSDLGQEAVRLLLSRMGDRDGAPREVLLQPELIVRKSTGNQPGSCTRPSL